jgi:nitrite reductase/ring-hydroxylating ferredoxin subunit
MAAVKCDPPAPASTIGAVSARYAVDADISRASTLSPAYYRDAAAWDATRERVFARTWQWLGDTADVCEPASLSPRTLLPGLLDEPLLLARDAAHALRCLSNVCTHRGNLVVREACRADHLRCGYHSRRFDLAGRMTFMPGFDGARTSPRPRTTCRRSRSASGRASRSPRSTGRALRRVRRRDARRPRRVAARPRGHDRDARPRLRGRRALGALRRELPRGLPPPFVHRA